MLMVIYCKPSKPPLLTNIHKADSKIKSVENVVENSPHRHRHICIAHKNVLTERIQQNIFRGYTE